MSQSDNIFYRLTTDRKRFKVFLFSLSAFCILAASLTFFTLSMGEPYMGTTLSIDEKGWVVKDVYPNSLASQAGIRVGDQPIEINGQLAGTFLEKYRSVGTVLSMLIRELTVVDEYGQLKSVSLQDGSPTWQSMIEPVTWLIVSFIFWITGFYVFLKRPRNMAALLLCLCGLFFGLTLSATLAGERAIPIAPQLAVVATVIGPWLLLHFFLVLPEERTSLHNNALVYLIYLPPAITLVLFPLIGYADGQPLPEFRSFRLLEYGVVFLATVGVAIFNYFHAASFRTRQQMKIVLIGCLAALVPFLVLNILPTAIEGQSILPPGFSILFVAFIPLGMGYAVVTKKLMDINVIIRRGVVYGLITVVMAAILSAAILPVVIFQESIGLPQGIFIVLALGGICAVLFGPAKKGIEILVDKVFYKDRYDYRLIIQSMSTALNSVNDITEVSRLIVGTTVGTLNLAGGALFVKAQSNSFEVGTTQGTYTDMSKQRQLLTLISKQSHMIVFPNPASTVYSDLAFLIPLTAGEKEVAILCLSPKVSSQDFSSNDMYLLQGIASVAAIALHSAMLIRDVSIRDTFVSVASHELRTPLTSIVGYADLLLRRDPPDVTRKRWLKNILANSQRVSNMVDDLLNVSRIASGKASIKLERVRLSDVFEEALSMTKESTIKHKFVVHIEPDLPDVIVARDKFGQVMENLLSNAVKYSPSGGRITFSAHNDKERHRIVLSVADEGMGIGPEDKDLLFTTFHRIQRPETQSIRGSGLGLYIAKEWTEMMGGKIWCESELNKGSTFFVAIPAHDSSGSPDRSSRHSEEDYEQEDTDSRR